mmetsp:Transcript_11856/g.37671  ORF Transcript_11856/g.37671 Transcript_11856/m.37671 type:complete len:226 (-) Transcript_11856:162-839(-)
MLRLRQVGPTLAELALGHNARGRVNNLGAEPAGDEVEVRHGRRQPFTQRVQQVTVGRGQLATLQALLGHLQEAGVQESVKLTRDDGAHRHGNLHVARHLRPGRLTKVGKRVVLNHVKLEEDVSRVEVQVTHLVVDVLDRLGIARRGRIAGSDELVGHTVHGGHDDGGSTMFVLLVLDDGTYLAKGRGRAQGRPAKLHDGDAAIVLGSFNGRDVQVRHVRKGTNDK